MMLHKNGNRSRRRYRSIPVLGLVFALILSAVFTGCGKRSAEGSKENTVASASGAEQAASEESSTASESADIAQSVIDSSEDAEKSSEVADSASSTTSAEENTDSSEDDGEQTDSTSSAASAAQSTEEGAGEEIPEEALQSLDDLQMILCDENMYAAIAYIGWDYTTYEAGDLSVEERVSMSPLAIYQPFVTYVNTIVDLGGDDVYLIVPAHDGIRAQVHEYCIDFEAETEDGYEEVIGKTVYDRTDGEPFLLVANVSDIVPNALLTLSDEEGGEVSFSPMISLADGSITLTNTETAYVRDITVPIEVGFEDYGDAQWNDHPAERDDLTGTWTSSYAADAEGNYKEIYLEFTEDGNFDLTVTDQEHTYFERYRGGYSFSTEEEGLISLYGDLYEGPEYAEGDDPVSFDAIYSVRVDDYGYIWLFWREGDLMSGTPNEVVYFIRSFG